MNLKYLKKIYLVSFILALLVNEGELWRRRRRRRCPVRNCSVSAWSHWSPCTHPCGNSGTQRRTRTKTSGESCGGKCPYAFVQTRACNRFCRNGGTPRNGYCACRKGFKGKCCQSDVNECSRRPCQHICVNTFGSYTCRCHACYTRVGNHCDLRRCKIGNKCYSYGTVNPSNFCQQCSSSNKISWSNINGKRCNDNNVKTKHDRCLNGACVGTPYSCLTCEQHDGVGCQLKVGHCLIGNTCFSNQQVNPSNPCQRCNSKYKHQWTNNNNLRCDDNSTKTRNDRCVSGACVGTPYECLECEKHNGIGCRQKQDYCVIEYKGARKCFNNKQVNPSNQCQWCKPSYSNSTWTQRIRGSGNWSMWADWSDCSKTCEGGTQSRNRTCPAPSQSECRKPCSGLDKETRQCNLHLCPDLGSGNGTWGAWGQWSECSVSCGGGIQQRIRTCTSPLPGDGKRNCSGSHSETRACSTYRCPVDCKSSPNGDYAHFTSCSKYVTCSNGFRHVRCCPIGLYYNPDKKRCSWPENVNCTNREAHYEAVGCFADKMTSRALSMYVGNLRDDIDWNNLNRTVRTCAKEVEGHCGWSYFGVQFYGECWSGANGAKTYDKHGLSQECFHGVGKQNANFVYRLIE